MVVGEVKESFGIYSDSIGTEMGKISIGETGIIIQTEKGRFAVPFDYVRSIETEGEMMLGKIKTEIAFSDVMGDSHKLKFIISEIKLGLLKKACGK